MNDPIECVDCEVEIPLRDVVQRYMRMIEVAPDAKVRAVACPTCLQAIPLSPAQIETVRSSALRANEAIEGIEDDYRSRHAAMLLLLAHELGLTPDACAEEDVVVRVRALVADAAAAKAHRVALRTIFDELDGECGKALCLPPGESMEQYGREPQWVVLEDAREIARAALAPSQLAAGQSKPERKFGAAAGLVAGGDAEDDEEGPWF